MSTQREKKPWGDEGETSGGSFCKETGARAAIEGNRVRSSQGRKRASQTGRGKVRGNCPGLIGQVEHEETRTFVKIFPCLRKS